MAFMKNINDPRGILTLLVLAIPTIAANIDCNGKPFHCLNSTHFMICVDVGSGVSSTLDDFVIPCPPTTVCKGTNRFECEFLGVTTTSAPLVATPPTSVSERTTPLYDVTTSIPFEEYYNTLSTTTLSEYIILTEQKYATESIVQPGTDTAQDIDVFIPNSEWNSSSSDIMQGIDVAQNNLTILTLMPNNISANASDGIPHATENVDTIASEPKAQSNLSEIIPAATNIVQYGLMNTSLLNNDFNSFTESILLETMETAPSVLTFTETVQSGYVDDIDTNTKSMSVKVTETIPSETTPSVDVVQHSLTTPETFVFINMSVDASDLISSTTENLTVTTTYPQTYLTSRENPSAKDIVNNDFTLIDALSSTALSTNTETIPDPHTQPITGTTENLNVITSVFLPNDADSAAENVTESIFLIVTSLVSVSTLAETVSSKNYDHIDAKNNDKVTEITPSESTGSTSSVNFVQNALQTRIHLSSNISANGSDILNATENASDNVTDPETNITFSETPKTTDIGPNERTPLNAFVSSTLPTEILNMIIPGSDTVSTLIPKDLAASDSTSLKSFGSTLTPNNITETITELTTPNVLNLGETMQSLGFVQNDFTTHKPLNSNINALNTPIPDAAETNNVISGIVSNVSLSEIISMTKDTNLSSLSTLSSNFMSDNVTNTITNPILKLAETTSSTLILSGNIPNVEAVPNDFKTPLPYGIIDNATENLKETNKTVIKVDPSDFGQNYFSALTSSSLTDAVTDTLQYDKAKPLISSSSAPHNNKEAFVITDNPIVIDTEYHSNQTFHGNLSEASVKSTPLYIESTIALQSGTEPTVATNNMSLNSLKSNKSNNDDVTNGVRQKEKPVETTTENYADSSVISKVTDSNVNNFETTPNSKLETTVFQQAMDSITSSNKYDYTDKNNIKNTEGIFTDQASGKAPLSEKVLSTGTENTVSTPTNNNHSTSYFGSTTHLTGLTPRPYTDTLIIDKEPLSSINNQKTDSILGGELKDSTLKSNGSLSTVNESGSNATVFATTIKLVPTTKITSGNMNEVITEPTTLGTTFTVTETNTVVFLETANDVPAPELSITESVVLPNPITIAATAKYLKPTTENDGYTTSTSIINEALSSTPLSTETGSVLYPTKETIATEVADNSHPVIPLQAESAKDISEMFNLTQILPSSLVDHVQSEIMSTSDTKPDTKTTSPLLGDSDFKISSPNTVQKENLHTITPDLFTSLDKTEIPAVNFIDMDENVKKPESSKGSSGNKLITNILAAINYVTVVTESNYPVNKATVTVSEATDLKYLTDNAPSTVNVEAIREHNPLSNLLLEQIPHIIPENPTENPSLESTSNRLETAINDVVGDSLIIENDVFIDSTLPESYTESIVRYTGATSQTSNETLAYGAAHAIGDTDQETGNSILVKNKPDAHKEYPQDIGTTPTPVESLEQSVKSPVDAVKNSPLHNTITESIPINNNIQSNTGKDKNDATIKVENGILLKPTTDAIVNTPKAAVESQVSQGISSHADVTNIPAVILNQDSITPKLERELSNTPTIELTTEPCRATVVTNPSQPMTHITTKGPIEESFTVITSDNTAQIASILDMDPVLLNTVTQYVVPQYVTRFSNFDQKFDIELTETPKAESLSQVPQTNENNVHTTTKPILDKTTSNVGSQKDTNVSNFNNIRPLTSDRTEFISITNDLLSQTEQLEPVITQNPLYLDKSIVMVDAAELEIPVLEEGSVVTGTHSGFSVLPKPPRKLIVELSERTEGSESVENRERKDEKENEERLETRESNKGVHTTTPVIATAIANPIEPISEAVLLTEQNENIYETITEGSEFSVTNIRTTLENPIEMTTMKMQDSDHGKHPIINIEQISPAIKSATETVTQAKNTDIIISSLKEKSVKNVSVVSTKPIYVINNTRSNIETSTTRYSHTTKSSFANTDNASLPAKKSVTNPHNFVCKQNSRGRFSDTKDCRKFYICIGKPEPIEGFCPNNTVFSELRKQCTKNLSHCVRNNQFQCIWEGRFSDYLNDNIYYICVKNVGTFIRFKLQCQSGYHLNKTSVRCELNTESSQSTSQQSTSDISKYIDQSGSSVKSEKLDSESSDQFVCKKEGKFPDTNNCRRYYVCKKKGKSEYKKRNKKCDSDEIFHKDKKKCVDADSYECN